MNFNPKLLPGQSPLVGVLGPKAPKWGGAAPRMIDTRSFEMH